MKHWWKWLCEFCFRKSNHNHLPVGWHLIWLSAVCPQCRKRVLEDGGYYFVCGGAYAQGKRDPRSTAALKIERERSE
jgi:hypothetical protein